MPLTCKYKNIMHRDVLIGDGLNSAGSHNPKNYSGTEKFSLPRDAVAFITL